MRQRDQQRAQQRARRREQRQEQRRGHRGAATAELALGIPLLVALTAGLVWMLAVGAAQVRVIDASREAARAVARGDEVAAAEAVALRIAPERARVRIAVGDSQVVVTTSVRVTGPGGLLASLPGVTVSADAVALVEVS
ncbi:TadE family protein [Nocardioides alpinus]|uniref:TadE family protein n=1 Tax=Nocardioides alpinus TaxID=748909 RepID=UPI001E36B86B|nr:TadE family protein [Nocardioides alpinus]